MCHVNVCNSCFLFKHATAAGSQDKFQHQLTNKVHIISYHIIISYINIVSLTAYPSDFSNTYFNLFRLVMVNSDKQALYLRILFQFKDGLEALE